MLTVPIITNFYSHSETILSTAVTSPFSFFFELYAFILTSTLFFFIGTTVALVQILTVEQY